MAMAKLFISERKAAPSLCMSMKISPRRAVLVFAGAQIDLVAADHRLLGVALAAVGQLLALAQALDALDHALDDALGDRGDARRRVLRDQRLDRVVVLVVVLDQLRVAAAATASSRRDRARWP